MHQPSQGENHCLHGSIHFSFQKPSAMFYREGNAINIFVSCQTYTVFLFETACWTVEQIHAFKRSLHQGVCVCASLHLYSLNQDTQKAQSSLRDWGGVLKPIWAFDGRLSAFPLSVAIQNTIVVLSSLIHVVPLRRNNNWGADWADLGNRLISHSLEELKRFLH